MLVTRDTGWELWFDNAISVYHRGNGNKHKINVNIDIFYYVNLIHKWNFAICKMKIAMKSFFHAEIESCQLQNDNYTCTMK